jgi:signal peptidase II
MSSARKYTVFGLAFGLSLFLDQVTKVWARASLRGHAPIVVVQDFFDFHYSENPGSAFGLFRDTPYARELLFGVGLVALVVIGVFLHRSPNGRLRLAAWLGLLGGGAVGNITDRILYGRVTDFIQWKVHTHEWPVFNVADAALVVGVIGLLFDAKPEDATAPAKAKSDEKGRAAAEEPSA